jgi:hypothetical protein
MVWRPLRLEPAHLWICLSDQAGPGSDVLTVNLSTLRETYVDDECILNPGEYLRVTRQSAVMFSRACLRNEGTLMTAIRNRQIEQLEDLPDSTLEKILAAARSSRQLSPRMKAYLARAS